MKDVLEKFIDGEVFDLTPDYPNDRNPWDPNKHPKNYNYIQSLIEEVDADDSRPPKYGNHVKLEVFKLRDKGKTLREIAEVVGVSKSTACLYMKNRKKIEAKIAKVRQPGTENIVETRYSVEEVNVGRLQAKKRGRKRK